MEQPFYLLLAAGVLIVIVSLFLPRRTRRDSRQKLLELQKQPERKELEMTLQHFVEQVKADNQRAIENMRQTKSELFSEVRELRERLQVLEAEIAELTRSGSAGAAPAPEEQTDEPTAADALLLRERYRQAFDLKAKGLPIEEIAKQLRAGQGEIELIFSLAAPNGRGGSHG
ncbi:DUF6115 domain-containing protein [Brevibacillus massiliensis]|jgi:hypothetical protein|uniref:DUF6115 domain-containing protein n=1 Tax=Brevibacillus massiliensis TaxID=1118054 RepID=UPI00031C6E19|nr:hypothetical protein [Brevibacillus massiliensis]